MLPMECPRCPELRKLALNLHVDRHGHELTCELCNTYFFMSRNDGGTIINVVSHYEYFVEPPAEDLAAFKLHGLQGLREVRRARGLW